MIGAYYNMVREFEKDKAAFVAMSETKQIVQLKNLVSQISIRKGTHQIVK